MLFSLMYSCGLNVIYCHNQRIFYKKLSLLKPPYFRVRLYVKRNDDTSSDFGTTGKRMKKRDKGSVFIRQPLDGHNECY